MNDQIAKLVEAFSHFPGVGPRQAKRFAFYLLTRDEKKVKYFADELVRSRASVASCVSCGRLFFVSGKLTLCAICKDDTRDTKQLMIVGHEVDIESVEKSGSYRGFYFVLGGNIPILDETPEKHVRLDALNKNVAERLSKGLSEIILALDVNPEGEHTMDYLSQTLSPLVAEKNVTITVLGRGLSTGTELQYSDPETIKNALKNRTST
jgi:recombination protein RecR